MAARLAMTTGFDYSPFLNSICKNHWLRLGLVRRAGVCTPLFSIFSKKSMGLGEILDLNLLVDWCGKTGMSLIQLLPMNDMGFNFTPYDAQTTFGLDPMYLSLEKITGIKVSTFNAAIKKLRQDFPAGGRRVNYGVKKAKLEVLWEMFQSSRAKASKKFKAFAQKNHFWLEDYALFKVIKEQHAEHSWRDWPEALKNHEAAALDSVRRESYRRVLFYQWLQWQLELQFQEAKAYANKRGVFIMGDLPFLVARDSADVWAHQNYFKLDLSSGAPPDSFFAMGQRWGMPPYHWPAMEARQFDYLVEKIHYAENFYDLFRMDHGVGTFRLWAIPVSEPPETGGLNGKFDPENEQEWEAHGRKLLSVMIQNSNMLPCAEDLGVVPECSYQTLWDFSIPGMEVQRWTKNWNTDCSFKAPSQYRRNAMTVISNHDMASFHGWWIYQAGTVDGELFKRKCQEKNLNFEMLKNELFDTVKSHHGRLRWREEISDTAIFLEKLQCSGDQVTELVEIYRGSYQEKQKFWDWLGFSGRFEEDPSPRLLEAAMGKASLSSAIFCIQLLQDLLDLGPIFQHDAWEFRINFPGTSGPHNWSLVLPVSLEQMNRLAVNAKIRKMNQKGDRV